MLEHTNKELAKRASAVLSSGGTVLLHGRFFAAVCSSPDGSAILEGYHWNEEVTSSTDYRVEEETVREVLQRTPKEVKHLKCTSVDFLGGVLASLRERGTNQGPLSYPYTYPYLPGDATPESFSLRPWFSSGPLQANEEPLSGKPETVWMPPPNISRSVACLSILRGLACLFFAPEKTSPPPRILSALSALSNGHLPLEQAAGVWACLHSYEWQRREGASSDVLSNPAFFKPLEGIIHPMLEMMQEANASRDTRFVAGLAKTSATIGIAIALEMGKSGAGWHLIGRRSPDQQRAVYISKDALLPFFRRYEAHLQDTNCRLSVSQQHQVISCPYFQPWIPKQR